MSIDPLSRLPVEIGHEILARGVLDPVDLYRCSLVSRHWHDFVSDDAVWRALAFQWGLVDRRRMTLVEAQHGKLAQEDRTLMDIVSVVRTWRELVLIYDLLARQTGRTLSGEEVALPLPVVHHIFSTLSHRSGGDSAEIRLRRAFIQDRFLAAEFLEVLAEDNLAIFASNYHDMGHVDRWALWVVDLQNSTLLWAYSSEEDDDVWGIAASDATLIVHHKSYVPGATRELIDVFKLESALGRSNPKRAHFRKRARLEPSPLGEQHVILLKGNIAVGQCARNPAMITFWDLSAGEKLEPTRTIQLIDPKIHRIPASAFQPAHRTNMDFPPFASAWDGEYFVACWSDEAGRAMLYVYHYPTRRCLLRRYSPDKVPYDGMVEPELFDVHAGGYPPEEAMQGIIKPAAPIGTLPQYGFLHDSVTPNTPSVMRLSLDTSTGTAVMVLRQTMILFRDYRQLGVAEEGQCCVALNLHDLPGSHSGGGDDVEPEERGPLAARDGRAIWGPLTMVDYGPLRSAQDVRVFFLSTEEDTQRVRPPSLTPRSDAVQRGPHSGVRNDRSPHGDPGTYLAEERLLARTLRKELYQYRVAKMTPTGAYFLVFAVGGLTAPALFNDDKRASVVHGLDFAGGAMLRLNRQVCGQALAKRARLDLYKRVRYNAFHSPEPIVHNPDAEWEDLPPDPPASRPLTRGPGRNNVLAVNGTLGTVDDAISALYDLEPGDRMYY